MLPWSASISILEQQATAEEPVYKIAWYSVKVPLLVIRDIIALVITSRTNLNLCIVSRWVESAGSWQLAADSWQLVLPTNVARWAAPGCSLSFFSAPATKAPHESKLNFSPFSLFRLQGKSPFLNFQFFLSFNSKWKNNLLLLSSLLLSLLSSFLLSLKLSLLFSFYCCLSHCCCCFWCR